MIGIPAGQKSDPEEVWQNNFNTIRDNINEEIGKLLVEDLYDFYTEEVGIEKVIKYLETQDKIEESSFNSSMDFGNFLLFTDNKINYKNDINEREDFLDEDDVDERFSKKIEHPTQYNVDAIKSNILKYFLNELVEDIPTDSILRDEKDVKDFIKMYEIKFLHERLIPISELKGDGFQN